MAQRAQSIEARRAVGDPEAYVETQYTTLQHTTTRCNAVHHVATQCTTLQHIAAYAKRIEARVDSVYESQQFGLRHGDAAPSALCTHARMHACTHTHAHAH